MSASDTWRIYRSISSWLSPYCFLMVATVGALKAKSPQIAKNAAPSQPTTALSDELYAMKPQPAAINNAASDQRTLTGVL